MSEGQPPHCPAYRVAHPYQPFSDRPPSLSSNTSRAFARGRGTRLSGEGRPAAPFRAIYKVRESAGTSLSKPQSSKKSPRAGSHCNGIEKTPCTLESFSPLQTSSCASLPAGCTSRPPESLDLSWGLLRRMGQDKCKDSGSCTYCMGILFHMPAAKNRVVSPLQHVMDIDHRFPRACTGAMDQNFCSRC